VTPAERSARVKHRAAALGFARTGVAPLEPNPHAADFDRWLAAGHAGTMTYLHRQAEKRKDPRRIMPGARVAVVTLTNYFHGAPRHGRGDRHPRVAQYAWSSDYHDVLGARLERLADAIRDVAPGAVTRGFVDAGPVPERELAQRAGLGWIGKNMMLIHPEIGSFTFIGVVLTDADLAPDLPFEADRCGTCRRCIDACPTEALVETARGWELDSRLCLSYLTIEHRGSIAEKDRPALGRHIFGCDICQDVCPWNRRAATSTAFSPVTEVPPPLDAMAALTEDEFRRLFQPTPVERTRYSGFLRNVAIAMGNSRLARFEAPLRRLAASADPVVAEHGEWALGELGLGRP